MSVAHAELIIDRHEFAVSGEHSWGDLEVPLLDPPAGRTVRFADDPEEWARHLPDAYCGGDVAIVESKESW
jgi:hypothetical protein